jgi:mannose-6-phosphate isomerase-like protein (cupin superfamily)
VSYPPALYEGTNGETTARIHPADAPPDLIYADGTTVHYLATGADSGGLMGLYRWTTGPVASGPDPHYHRTIAESFYILSGSMLIYNGHDWVDTEPGDFVFVPPGGIHGFRSKTGVPASMLLLFTPGAPREGYFEGLVGIAEMNDDERLAFYLEHDNHWIE